MSGSATSPHAAARNVQARRRQTKLSGPHVGAEQRSFQSSLPQAQKRARAPARISFGKSRLDAFTGCQSVATTRVRLKSTVKRVPFHREASVESSQTILTNETTTDDSHQTEKWENDHNHAEIAEINAEGHSMVSIIIDEDEPSSSEPAAAIEGDDSDIEIIEPPYTPLTNERLRSVDRTLKVGRSIIRSSAEVQAQVDRIRKRVRYVDDVLNCPVVETIILPPENRQPTPDSQPFKLLARNEIGDFKLLENIVIPQVVGAQAAAYNLTANPKMSPAWTPLSTPLSTSNDHFNRTLAPAWSPPIRSSPSASSSTQPVRHAAPTPIRSLMHVSWEPLVCPAMRQPGGCRKVGCPFMHTLDKIFDIWEGTFKLIIPQNVFKLRLLMAMNSLEH